MVRSRVIPWLVREEIQQIPSAPAVQAMHTQLRTIAKSSGPIVVGPWLSEVGYELLYWIPFLTWATKAYGIAPERLTVVTRGGAGTWYRELCHRAVDVFDLYSVDDFRQKNESRWAEDGNQKQLTSSAFDHEIADRVRERLGDRSITMMHPSVMYRMLRYYWFEKGAVSLLKDHTEYVRLPSAGEPIPDLPRDYVALRFYFRPSFPDTRENRRFIASTVKSIARHTAVVVLNTGLNLDDHEDFSPDEDVRVHRVDHLMTPSRNLEIQSRVIQHARAFVGTYGGLAYLGPFYGVPSVGVYSDIKHIVLTHLDTSERLCRHVDSSLVTLDTASAGPLQMMFDGGARDATESSERHP